MESVLWILTEDSSATNHPKTDPSSYLINYSAGMMFLVKQKPWIPSEVCQWSFLSGSDFILGEKKFFIREESCLKAFFHLVHRYALYASRLDTPLNTLKECLTYFGHRFALRSKCRSIQWLLKVLFLLYLTKIMWPLDLGICAKFFPAHSFLSDFDQTLL